MLPEATIKFLNVRFDDYRGFRKYDKAMFWKKLMGKENSEINQL
jgi:hypothetical protein